MADQAKKKSILSMDLSLKKSAAKSIPNKHGINFIHDTKRTTNIHAVILFAIFLVFLAGFTYFGVIRLLQAANAAEAEYNAMQDSIAQLNAAMADYDDVQTQYNETVGSFMQGDETISTDRIEMIDMINEDIGSSIQLSDISISGTSITVTTDETTLDVISNVIDRLQKDERNTYAGVTTTSARNSNDNDQVIAQFKITYGRKNEEAAGGDNQ